MDYSPSAHEKQQCQELLETINSPPSSSGELVVGQEVWVKAVYNSETTDGTHIIEVSEMGDEVATLMEVPIQSIRIPPTTRKEKP